MKLVMTKRTDPLILEDMSNHYSAPKGFVGRNICYRIEHDGSYLGSIVGGSATLHLPGRAEFVSGAEIDLNTVVNNIFFHMRRPEGGYPVRNCLSRVLSMFREAVTKDWMIRYGDPVRLFETLVELPRTGECYIRDGWTLGGQTKGFTCKRVAGKGSDSWSGKRVWNTQDLRPKLTFFRRNTCVPT